MFDIVQWKEVTMVTALEKKRNCCFVDLKMKARINSVNGVPHYVRMEGKKNSPLQLEYTP